MEIGIGIGGRGRGRGCVRPGVRAGSTRVSDTGADAQDEDPGVLEKVAPRGGPVARLERVFNRLRNLCGADHDLTSPPASPGSDRTPAIASAARLTAAWIR